MNNLDIIHDTDFATISVKLAGRGIHKAHFTNGTYAPLSDICVPTTLAGFKYIDDQFNTDGAALIIAVNSDVSMARINELKVQKGESVNESEDQYTRALKVAKPLAETFPDRDVIVVFYDEETPTELYDALAEREFGMESLQKWGYGTSEKAGRIEGAHNFNRVFGFPFPNDTRELAPYCNSLTPREEQDVIVKRLTTETGSHGAPYLTEGNKILFPLSTELGVFSAEPSSRIVGNTNLPPSP